MSDYGMVVKGVWFAVTMGGIMKFAKPALAEAYWHSLSQDQGVPARETLDPRAMSPYLPNVFLADRISYGVARFRVCGSHLTELMGMEPAGMHVSALFGVGARTTVATAIDAVCARPCLADLDLEASASEGRGLLHARLFLAPLTDGSGQINRVLGCLQAKGSIGNEPRKFDWARVGFRNTWQAQGATQTAEPVLRRIAVAAQTAEPVHAATMPSARPNLRLVHSSD